MSAILGERVSQEAHLIDVSPKANVDGWVDGCVGTRDVDWMCITLIP